MGQRADACGDDNTGSMGQDGKMPSLQTASKSLIDQLSALAKNPGGIFISIIPFAKDVMSVSATTTRTDRLECRQQQVQQKFIHGTKLLCSQRQNLDCSEPQYWNRCVWDRDQNYPSYTYKDPIILPIILLSDGLNTQDRWYSDASQIDARPKILCDNAKAAGITIYTTRQSGRPDVILRQRC